MANVTDPLAAALSGSDPQNAMEYITRQKIYESRYWKEECFGLTVADVLEKAASSLTCIGHLPTHFLALSLKLLQLHPDPELVYETFVAQDEFKYVRALGALYVRWTTARHPAEVYAWLEPLLADHRTLRVYVAPEWSLTHVDEFVHDLLRRTRVLGMALPRMPARNILQDAGYLEGPRISPLSEQVEQHGGVKEYLRYKAEIQQIPAAIQLWEERYGPLGTTDRDEPPPRKKRAKSASSKYGTLFKENKGTLMSGDNNSTTNNTTPNESQPAPEGSEEYWNQERAKLGLAPLK